MRIIQKSDKKNVPSLLRIMKRVWPDQRPDEARVLAALQDTSHAAFAALMDDQVAGFVDGFLTTSGSGTKRWEVDLLAVAPAYQRKGLGTKLVAACVEAGKYHGADLARGLIQIENYSSQKAFQHCGFTLQPQVYQLYTGKSGNPNNPKSHAGGTLIKVQTFSYSGLWLEDDFSPSALEYGLRMQAAGGWDLVGTLIPQEQSASIQAARTLGYSLVDSYQWWVK